MSDKRICVGAVTRPHGVRGDVCVDWYADDPSFLDQELRMEVPGGAARQVRARSWRVHKGGLLVTMEGVASRDAAEALRGATLWITRNSLPELPEGEAYIEDLLGRAVTLTDGTPCGVFHHVEMPAGQMLWALRDETGEVLFPAHRQFIVSLDDPIVIDPPEGLLDACRTPLRRQTTSGRI